MMNVQSKDGTRIAFWRSGTGPALVFHAAEERLARRLASLLPGRARVVPFSPAMAIHTGPGWIGVAWLEP